MKTLYILFLFVFVSTQTLFAVSIEGIVLDKNTNMPIQDAVVLALENNNVVASANSSEKGGFKIELKKGKKIRLEVVKNGYRTENTNIEITKEFISLRPTVVIKLRARTKKQSENIIVNENEMENVGALSSLPEGYRIIEAVPVKKREQKKSNFNVRAEVKDPTTNVNVKVLKNEYNKDFESEVLKSNRNFATSYYKNGAIYYNVSKAFLSDDAKAALKDLVAKLQANATSSLKLIAYSDADRELEIADFICKMRVEEITKFLLAEGVRFEQLDITIYGHQLLENNCIEGADCTDAQHQENRKVVLKFLE